MKKVISNETIHYSRVDSLLQDCIKNLKRYVDSVSDGISSVHVDFKYGTTPDLYYLIDDLKNIEYISGHYAKTFKMIQDDYEITEVDM